MPWKAPLYRLRPSARHSGSRFLRTSYLWTSEQKQPPLCATCSIPFPSPAPESQKNLLYRILFSDTAGFFTIFQISLSVPLKTPASQNSRFSWHVSHLPKSWQPLPLPPRYPFSKSRKHPQSVPRIPFFWHG